MKCILVATDFSQRSERAVQQGARLAKSFGAKLHALHVVDEDQAAQLANAAVKEATALLDALGASLGKDGVDVSVAIVRGEAFEEINRHAEKVGAALIVVGSHRRNPLRNAFVGTTSDRMLRLSQIPVLVVRAAEPGDYQRVLVALDFTEGDLSALERLRELGIAKAENLRAVFAYEAGNFHLLRRAGATVGELKAYFEEEKERVLPSIDAMMRQVGLKSEQAILKPTLFNASDTILEAVEEVGADLLVVGARRKTAFQRFTLGSVSEGILRRASIDVLVLPPQ